MPTYTPDNIYVVTVCCLFIFFTALSAIAAIFGVKDVIVNKKTIDYSIARQKEENAEFLKTLDDADDLDAHAAGAPDMRFYQKQ